MKRPSNGSATRRRRAYAATFLLTTTARILLDLRGLTRMVYEAFNEQFVGTIFHELDYGIVDGIFVLFQPLGKIV